MSVKVSGVVGDPHAVSRVLCDTGRQFSGTDRATGGARAQHGVGHRACRPYVRSARGARLTNEAGTTLLRSGSPHGEDLLTSVQGLFLNFPVHLSGSLVLKVASLLKLSRCNSVRSFEWEQLEGL